MRKSHKQFKSCKVRQHYHPFGSKTEYCEVSHVFRCGWRGVAGAFCLGPWQAGVQL